MVIKANEIEKYMALHNVDKIPVEVLNIDIEANKSLNQTARKLAKRLIITSAHADKFGYKPKVDAVQLRYVMYNSFKKSTCYVPPGFELDVLDAELGKKMLAEFADHGGNLEQKFRDAFAKHNPEIQDKLNEANKLIAEAEALSEKHGIPFSPPNGFMDNMPTAFVPQSFSNIFGDLLNDDEGSEVIGDVTDVYNTEYTGWQNSSSSC